MQIIELTKGGALSRLASQQEASQDNWFNLLNRNKVLAKSCYRGHLFVYFTFPIQYKQIKLTNLIQKSVTNMFGESKGTISYFC